MSLRQTFWTGETGRLLRRDRDCQVLALYLISAPGRHPSGLFYMPAVTAAHHTGMSVSEVMDALDHLAEAGFIRSDEEAEAVWVVNMAAEQMPEPPLTEADMASLARHLGDFAKSPLLAGWMERYGAVYGVRVHEPRQVQAQVLEWSSRSPRQPTQRGHDVSSVSSLSHLEKEQTMQDKTRGAKQDTAPAPASRRKQEGEVDWRPMVDESLRCPEFLDAYGEWLQSRKERKLKPLGVIGIRKQLQFLARLGLLPALESIDASIRNGWQGLFEPSTPSFRRSSASVQPARGTDFEASSRTQDALDALVTDDDAVVHQEA